MVERSQRLYLPAVFPSRSTRDDPYGMEWLRLACREAGTSGLAAGPLENKPDVVEHTRAFEVFAIELILQMPLVEERFGINFVNYVRAAQKVR